jgi:hypothetical protein
LTYSTLLRPKYCAPASADTRVSINSVAEIVEGRIRTLVVTQLFRWGQEPNFLDWRFGDLEISRA